MESLDDLLCPKRIDAVDFRSHLDKKLSKHEYDLFTKWYKPVDVDTANGHYRLEIDFSSHSFKSSGVEELGKLVRLLYTHFENASGNETTEDQHLSNSLRLKYLKSVQQDELEMISRRVPDPNTIVWVHLVGGGGGGGGVSVSGVNEAVCKLNKARYAHMFDLLKDKVLNHNYKQIRVGDTDLHRQHLDSISDFLFNSIKLIVDSLAADIDKISIGVMSLSMFLIFLKKFC